MMTETTGDVHCLCCEYSAGPMTMSNLINWLRFQFTNSCMKVLQRTLSDWMPSSGGVPGTSHQEEAQGTAQDTLEGLCLSAGLGTPWTPPRRTGGGGVWGEGCLGVSAESAAPATRFRIKRKTTSTSTFRMQGKGLHSASFRSKNVHEEF
ncbi:hypothetical protein GOODEAATRI_021659 [Goodea atripinnis]|uniref:Uncharacterized protein n=1 Tax=Goodea atripinnis TaxID=208336 RepID=A0ABV0MJU0_9TELE